MTDAQRAALEGLVARLAHIADPTVNLWLSSSRNALTGACELAEGDEMRLIGTGARLAHRFAPVPRSPSVSPALGADYGPIERRATAVFSEGFKSPEFRGAFAPDGTPTGRVYDRAPTRQDLPAPWGDTSTTPRRPSVVLTRAEAKRAASWFTVLLGTSTIDPTPEDRALADILHKASDER
jgi:hypothetical protein